MTEQRSDELLKEQGIWTKVERDLDLINDLDMNEENVIHHTSPADDGEATEVDDGD